MNSSIVSIHDWKGAEHIETTWDSPTIESPIQNYTFRLTQSNYTAATGNIMQRILLCFLLTFLSTMLFNVSCKSPIPPIVHFFYSVILRRNVSLEEIECFLSPEWELCNLTVSKIVLKEIIVEDVITYEKWKSMPVKPNLFNNWTKIQKLNRFLFNCRMSSRLWFANVYCEFLKGRFNSHISQLTERYNPCFQNAIKISPHN